MTFPRTRKRCSARRFRRTGNSCPDSENWQRNSIWRSPSRFWKRQRNGQEMRSACLTATGGGCTPTPRVHTCDFGDECRLDAGEDFFVASLDTEEGAVQVGSMICYDREFPESARILMLKGAELILTPNACPMEINRLSQLRGRAYENMTAIATCNYPSPHPDCNGHSTVFDGVAYLPELSGSRNTCILEAGEDFFVASLDTEEGTVQVGSMICYDREFPESARILMLKAAELILTPNACPMEINRLSQLRGRAYENMTAIATCNYPSPHPDCNGHSTVFDGVAYLPELSGSRNTCILEAGEGEGIYLAELNLDMLREYRKREVHGNAYRRPEKYGILTETAIQEPFIRADRRRECSETVRYNEKV